MFAQAATQKFATARNVRLYFSAFHETDEIVHGPGWLVWRRWNASDKKGLHPLVRTVGFVVILAGCLGALPFNSTVSDEGKHASRLLIIPRIMLETTYGPLLTSSPCSARLYCCTPFHSRVYLEVFRQSPIFFCVGEILPCSSRDHAIL